MVRKCHSLSRSSEPEIRIVSEGVGREDLESIKKELNEMGSTVITSPFKASAEIVIVHTIAITFVIFSKEIYEKVGKVIIRKAAALGKSALLKTSGPYSFTGEFKANGIESKIIVSTSDKKAFEAAMDMYDAEFDKVVQLANSSDLPAETWILADEYDNKQEVFKLRIVTDFARKRIEYDERSGTWKEY
jgi:hypothetical protein